MKTAIAITLMASLATPALAAGEKPEANAGKGMHCRKLAIEKYKVQARMGLNKAIGPAIQR